MQSRRSPAVFAIAVASAATSASPFVAADDSRTCVLELTTERVVVFKDGYALILKRGRAITDSEGEIHTEEVPDAAVLGSFWATPGSGRLLSMDAGTVTASETTSRAVPCVQHIEILEANKGKDCVLDLRDGQMLRGTIRDVLVSNTTVAPSAAFLSSLHLPPPGRPLASALPDPADYSMAAISGSLFVLATDDGDVLVQVGEIRRLTISDMALTTDREITRTTTTKRLTFRFAEKGVQRDVVLMYFVPGMRWIPTYRVELPGEGRGDPAGITLQAELLNEIEDFAEVPIDLVVGVPNMRYRNIISPFSLEATLRNALRQAAPNLMGNDVISNALFSQRSGEHRPERSPSRSATPDAGALELPPELTAGAAQDFFIYNLPPMSLKKGHRAAVTIFTAKAPVRDVYTWDVHVKRSDIEAAPSGSGVVSPLALSRDQIWHQLELINHTEVPWTTGPALLVQGHRPLAQELLTYTPPGSSVRVPVTVAVDVRGSFAEEETGRTLEALKWRYDYARIDKAAKLTLVNHKRVPIGLEITCRLGGRVTRASHGGEIRLDAFASDDWTNYRGDAAVNNHSQVTWRLEIGPGEKIEPEIEYHYFARQ